MKTSFSEINNLIVRLDVFAKCQVLQGVFMATEHLVTSHDYILNNDLYIIALNP